MLPLPPPWRYFAKRSDRVVGGWVGPEHLPSVLRELEGFDCFVTLNPSRGLAMRASLDTVTGWRAVLVDLDLDGGTSVTTRDLDDVVAAASLLLGVELAPAIIDTGRGMHLWLLFDEIPAPSWAGAATRQFLNALARAVANDRWHVDTGVSDLARLARLPGSVNSRTGRRVQVLTPGVSAPGIPGALEAGFRRTDLSAHERSVTSIVDASAPWGLFLHVITESAARFLSEGAPNGSRHDALCRTAFSLRDHGCGEDGLVQALLFGNQLCEEPLPAYEVVRVAISTQRRWRVSLG